jgi:predicted transcriptional regulator
MPNLIKQVKDKYNLSYREISKVTGIKESTLNSKATSKEPLTDTIKRPLELYIRTRELEEDKNGLEYLKIALRKFIKE